MGWARESPGERGEHPSSLKQRSSTPHVTLRVKTVAITVESMCVYIYTYNHTYELPKMLIFKMICDDLSPSKSDGCLNEFHRQGLRMPESSACPQALGRTRRRYDLGHLIDNIC